MFCLILKILNGCDFCFVLFNNDSVASVICTQFKQHTRQQLYTQASDVVRGGGDRKISRQNDDKMMCQTIILDPFDLIIKTLNNNLLFKSREECGHFVIRESYLTMISESLSGAHMLYL